MRKAPGMGRARGGRSASRLMCVLASSWGEEPAGPETAGALLLERGVAPRAAAERATGSEARSRGAAPAPVRLWLDVRGLAVTRVVARVRAELDACGAADVRVGVAGSVVAAYAAACAAGAVDARAAGGAAGAASAARATSAAGAESGANQAVALYGAV